jgi:hypothetical protein
MHDPMTVAFEIRFPIKKRSVSEFDQRVYGKWMPRSPIVTVWHVDPERDGSDDSCGWAFVKCSEADREWAKKAAKDEWSFWFSMDYASINLASAGHIQILYAAWQEALFYLKKRPRWKPLPSKHVTRVLSLASYPHDNIIASAREAQDNEDGLVRLLLCAVRLIRTDERPWWRKPRWHFHHWKFQVHCVEQFKRWAFSRCCKCGKGFKYGESPVTDSWHGKGPQWFTGEPNIYHSACPATPAEEASK